MFLLFPDTFGKDWKVQSLEIWKVRRLKGRDKCTFRTRGVRSVLSRRSSKAQSASLGIVVGKKRKNKGSSPKKHCQRHDEPTDFPVFGQLILDNRWSNIQRMTSDECIGWESSCQEEAQGGHIISEEENVEEKNTPPVTINSFFVHLCNLQCSIKFLFCNCCNIPGWVYVWLPCEC